MFTLSQVRMDAIATRASQLVDSRFRGNNVQGRAFYGGSGRTICVGNGLPCGCTRSQGGRSLDVRSRDAVPHLRTRFHGLVEGGTGYLYVAPRSGRQVTTHEGDVLV